jgi:hypothetical protein
MSEIEDLLLAKVTKEELELAISNKIEEMHGLVDREKAMSMIAIEKGLVKIQKTRISELRDGLKGINLEAKVDYVSELVKTQKSSFRDIGLISGEGKAVLRLWGTKYNEFRLIYGDEIELGNCSYSYNAVQLGNEGQLKIAKRGTAVPAGKLAEAGEGIYNVKGSLVKKENGYFIADQESKLEIPAEINNDIGSCEAMLERFSWDGKALAQTQHSRVFKKMLRQE